MGPSVKHVLGVLEWSCVVPEKNLFFLSKIEFGSFLLDFFCATFPKSEKYFCHIYIFILAGFCFV